jgi:uncharacterized protein
VSLELILKHGILLNGLWKEANGHYSLCYLEQGLFYLLPARKKKVEGLWPTDYFLRRQLWLLVFGLFNAFVLLWFWDILFQYAIIGIVMFAFRRLSPKTLIIGAVLSLLLMTARENVDAYRQRQVIVKGEQIAKIDTTVTKLTDERKEALEAMTGFREKASPAAKKKQVEKNLAAVRGSYSGFINIRVKEVFLVKFIIPTMDYGILWSLCFSAWPFLKMG